MQPEIYRVMYRMVHKYGWNWGITRGLINRRFGTNYTADELKELYRRHFLSKRSAARQIYAKNVNILFCPRIFLSFLLILFSKSNIIALRYIE